MPLKEEDHHLIEKYLLALLSPEEQALFEQKLHDADFVTELDFQKDLKVAFKAEGRDHLKEQLKGFEKKLEVPASQESTSSPFRIGRILAIAATLAFLLTAGYWLLNSSPAEGQLYAQYFEPYPNVVAPISKSAAKFDRRGEAFQTYELKNYSEAIQRFNQLNTQDDTVKFYRGLCQLALNQPEKAILDFESMKTRSTAFFAPMHWYKALAFLKSGTLDKAKIALNIVIQNAETKGLKEQASELLGQLE